MDYEIGVQVYTKNKGAIATRGRNTETEGRFIHQSQLTPVYAERPSAVMSIDARLSELRKKLRGTSEAQPRSTGMTADEEASAPVLETKP